MDKKEKYERAKKSFQESYKTSRTHTGRNYFVQLYYLALSIIFGKD